jgi:alkanesulfonate monooxygenase SsuD/methylene tetrahydromethanopterin reductase-like flavin-dependent oxidoreductase (luciferase family)
MARAGRVIARGREVTLEEWALVGEPDEVADGIARYRERFGMTHMIARSPIPGVDDAELQASLAHIAALG